MNDRYGTFRGLVRLRLAQVEVALGQGAIRAGVPAAVRRIVFVCHGNICRSAFAEVAARQAGINVGSFGLSAGSGRPAHEPAIEAAAAMGHDLTRHRATALQDYAPQDGDLLLAMETRQLRRIAADARLTDLPRSLLGLYTEPRVPHLHDPYGLSPAYMRTCLRRIESAIPVLKAAFPNACAD